jgi:mono/diheme cytochrome c family protein
VRKLLPLLLLAACDKANEAGTAVPVDPAALYAQNCARCHGKDGKPSAELRQAMPVRDFTDPEFRDKVTNEQIEQVIMAGRNLMPPFGGTLSMAKIQAVTGHIRRLGAK